MEVYARYNHTGYCLFLSVSPAVAQVSTDTITPCSYKPIPILTSVTTDTLPTSIDPQLLELTNSRVPKEYIIGRIKITGTKFLDEQLLISISGLNLGDKVTIPGGDNFSKAINNLWNQNLIR